MENYDKLFDLSGKNIIVIGACGLIGKEICKGLTTFNANIILVDNDKKRLNDLHIELKDISNSNIVNYLVDITKQESVDDFFAQYANDIGTIDGLVNVAYPRNKTYGAKFEDIEFDSWRENIDLHLNSCFYISQQASKMMMVQRSGNIINFGSIYGVVGPDFSIYEETNMTNPAEYSAVKGGIINFTRYLSTYLAKYNIRANCISPGGISSNQPDTFVDKYSDKTPMGRMGNPNEIVGCCIYLLSDASSFVTGQNLIIDGGWTVW